MKLESRSLRLSQDVRVLSKYMMPFGMKALSEALERHAVSLEEFDIILPHMSSYYFEPKVRATIRKLAPGKEVPFWTNLKSAGNTGAASAYIMLDEFFRSRTLKPGERILLFVPESGQFNYVLISMTAV